MSLVIQYGLSKLGLAKRQSDESGQHGTLKTEPETTMKYICLGCFDEKKFEAMSERVRERPKSNGSFVVPLNGTIGCLSGQA